MRKVFWWKVKWSKVEGQSHKVTQHVCSNSIDHNEWMNEWFIWLTCDKKPAESQFSPTHASTKKITKKLKQNAGRCEVRDGSSVEVQWAVQWVGEDLWWEGFVEQVCLESGMEETGSDAWSGWWQMMNEPEDYSKDWEMHTGKNDLWFWVRKMRVDERLWWEMTNECGQEAEQRSGYGDKQVEQ